MLGVCGSIASGSRTGNESCPLIPEPIAAQVFPLSMLFRKPRRSVPAYNVSGFCGSITAETNGIARKFVLIALQLTPPSVLLNAPDHAAGVAYKVFESRGSIVRE